MISYSKSDLRLTQGHWKSCHSIDDFLLFSIVTMSLLHRFKILSIISENLERHHVTVAMPIQGTVCNPNDKSSHGEPVYKVRSLQL